MTYDVNSGSWTAAELLSDVRRRAVLPATSTDWTDAALYRECTDVLWSFVGWAMQQAGDGRLSEMFNRSVSAALGSSYRAASEFELPPLAVADTIEGVTWVDDSGTSERRLQRIDVSEQSLYDQADSFGDPAMYCFLSGRIRIMPQPTTGGVVRFQYQRRHPHLIADTTANVGTTLSISDAGSGYTTFTLSTTTPFALGDSVDLISNQSPYRALFTSLSVGTSAGSSTQLYVPYSYLSSLALSGVRLVDSGSSPYIHYPLELRAAVTEKVAANVLRTIGDRAGAADCEAMAQSELGRVLQMLSPRAKRDRPKVINPYSLMRRGVR
jgi:hypothetical protein